MSDDSLPPEVRALLEARAVRMAAPSALGIDDGALEHDTLWLATFTVGDIEVAVPLASIRAAIPLRRVTSVPLAPREIVGIVRWNGQVVPVCSLAILLGEERSRGDSTTLLVVEGAAGRTLALDCAQIPLAVRHSLREIDAARARPRAALASRPAAGRGRAAGPSAIVELRREDRALLLLELDRIFGDEA